MNNDAANPKRRFTRAEAASATAVSGGIPAEVLEDPLLNAAIDSLLPSNYNFEIHKTVHQVRKYGATCVALQMPEGLTMWATAIADILERYVLFLWLTVQIYRCYLGDYGRCDIRRMLRR